MIPFKAVLRNNFLTKKGEKHGSRRTGYRHQAEDPEKQGKPSTQRWLLGELRKDGFPDLSESTLSSILSGNYVVGCANEVLTKAAKIIDAADKT